MKRVLMRLVPALLALLLILSVTGAMAESAYGVVTTDQVMVRKQPSTGAKYWFRVDGGFVCEILKVVTEGEETWYKVNSPHPQANGRTYIGYIHGDFFRPMTAEETAAYLGGQGSTVVTAAPAAPTAQVVTATPAPTIQPSTDDVFGGMFDVGIMGGATNAPTATPYYAPEDEEDSAQGGTDAGTDNSFGSDSSFGSTNVVNATGEITASGTNFRVTPSTQGGLIGKLSEGTVVEIVTIPAEINENNWYRIRYNGQEGYVLSPYVRVLTVGYTPAPVPSYYGYAKLLYDSANLRDAPAGTTQAQWEGKSSLLQIVGPSQSKNGYDWYPVYFGLDNKTYYVREDVIEVVSAGGSAAVPVTPVPGVSGQYGYVITTENGVNLRLKPGGETVAQIPRGTVVQCIGVPAEPENSVYTWFYVQYNNLRGYLRGDCVRICTADGGEIVATATPAPTQTVTAYGYVKLVKDSVNLRAKPAGTSQGHLPQDLILPLTGAKVSGGKYDWYPVRTADGRTGYVRSDCIMLCDVNGNEVTATPTPAPGATVTNAPTLSAYGYVQITEAGTNLRDKVAGSTIHQLKKNSVWPMIGVSVTYGQYTWYPIQAEGYTGFVRGDCAFKLSASQEMSYLQGNGVPVETPSPADVLSPYVITVMDYVNLRATPSRDAAAPFKVRTGTVMAFNEEKQVGTSLWYRVIYNNTEVWVLGTCVDVMTVAEYQAWLNANPGATPDDDANVGFIKTTESGVNVRATAAGSRIVERVAKGVVLPYYSKTSKNGYVWYEVRTKAGNTGFIRDDVAAVCDANGGALPTATPVVGGSNSGSTGQEASYSTLRLGSTGTAVKNLVTELKNQGYYTGSITSTFNSEVRNAVVAFQTAKGLTVDGIAGSQTQHALYGTVPVGSGDYTNLSFDFYPVEKIDWYTGGIQQLWAKGANYKIYDVKTGIVWWAHRWSGAAHADIETLTAADTARLCQIYGVDDAQEIYDKNLWQRRPCLVTIGTRTFACSLDGMPHNPDGDTIANNNMTGQICLHFTNSKGHESGQVSSSHQQAIEYAYNNCPAGKK